MRTEAVEQGPQRKYQARFEEVKNRLGKAGEIVIQEGEESLVIELNPSRLKAEFPNEDEIVSLHHFTTFTGGKQRVVEVDQTIVLSPNGVVGFDLDPARNNITVLPYQGHSIRFTDSDDSELRTILTNRAFVLVDEFLNGSVESPAPQPAITS